MLLALLSLALIAVVLALPLISRQLGGWRKRQVARRAARTSPLDIPLYDPGRERRAEQRARELLRSCVNDEEWGMYRDLGFIRVTGRLWRKDRASADEGPGRRDGDDTDEDDRDLDGRTSGDEHDFDGPDGENERAGRLPRSPQSRRSARRLPDNEPDTLQRRRREAAEREAADPASRGDAVRGSSPGGSGARGSPARGSSARGGPRGERGASQGGGPADDAPYAYLIYPHKPIVAY